MPGTVLERPDIYVPSGGARRSRTADLLNAIQALYQLSYGPETDGNRRNAEPGRADHNGCRASDQVPFRNNGHLIALLQKISLKILVVAGVFNHFRDFFVG